MKNSIKIIRFLLLTFVLTFVSTLTAFAADSSITFNGQTTSFTFTPGSEYTTTDLFDNFKNVMPGDTLTEIITVTNNATGSDYIKLYMRSVVHDENGNPLTYSESFEAIDGKDQTGAIGQRDETVATMADFLAQLSMKVYNGEVLIYDASPDELDGLAENVLLGTFRYGESRTLTVKLAVPIELGNEYANRVGEADWVFTVEALDDPEQTSTPTPAPKPENTPASTPEASDEPADTPNEPDEESESTPAPEVVTPETGDNLHLGRYIVLVLTCIVVLLIMKKLTVKRNKEK